jgi:DNA-binding response OmpR family regulator
MLTAAAQAADRARGLAAGADEYLTKPFSPLALLSLVRSLLPEVPVWPAP